ncbi:MAG: DUF4127 family protein [Synergistaceae bacterium]|nr:DUF4127 family protein [Synergistaceae bacterium]
MKKILLLILLLAVCVLEQPAGSETQRVIGFIPLDTRPYTYDIPIQLGKLFGAKILYPDMDILTFFREKPKSTALLRSWLLQTAKKCDALVVSAEQLLYGGLIQSREVKISISDRNEIIKTLRTIKKAHPNLKIYASNVLMRNSISAFDNESVFWWKKIQEYSKAYYRAYAKGDIEAKAELKNLTAEIPEKVLNTFLHARKFGYGDKLAFIQLVKDGIIDQLIICQEDSEAEGIQRFEQEEILSMIQKEGLTDKIYMANGAGEAGAELVMRALCPDGSDTKIVWLGENINFSAMYEDRPFVENLKSHMSALNIRETSNADNVICILPPKRKQSDYVMGFSEGYEEYSSEEFEVMSQRISDLVKNGKHVFLLDIEAANGGNPKLLTAVAKKIPILELYGYSAWDTASNSLGTLLAQLLACKNKNSEENKSYTSERILNDCVYQSIVRQKVSEKLKNAGVNVWNIEDTKTAEQLISDTFQENEELLHNIFGDNVPKFQTKLRWPRLFEIKVSL